MVVPIGGLGGAGGTLTAHSSASGRRLLIATPRAITPRRSTQRQARPGGRAPAGRVDPPNGQGLVRFMGLSVSR